MIATATAPNHPTMLNAINALSNTFVISSYLHLYYMKYTYRIQPKSKNSLLAIASDSI